MTVHPAVIHYNGVNGELKRKCLMVLSDENGAHCRDSGRVLKGRRWLDQTESGAHPTYPLSVRFTDKSVQERYYLQPSVTAQGHVRHICVMAVLCTMARVHAMA